MKAFRTCAKLLCLLLVLSLAGCAAPSKEQNVEPETDDQEITIYASFYPVYALADMIVQDVPGAHLECLVQPQDGCLRNYQLSDWDLALLRGSADAVLCAGRGLESFESVLYTLGEDGPAVVSLLHNAELSSGEADSVSENAHWTGENPHIYMKIDGALEMVRSIAASLETLDPKFAGIYQDKLAKAENDLNALREEMHKTAGDLSGNAVILMNEALVYLAEEYGLQTESFIYRESGEALNDHELNVCLEQLKNCKAKVILIEKQAPSRLCEELEAAGYSVAKLDVLSTRSKYEAANAYFEAQLENAKMLKAAFEATGET